MKNEHGVVKALTAAVLWQPSTAYEQGQEVRSPNMPAGFVAVCKTSGISGTNEPDWGTGGNEVSDASCVWKVTKGTITVNGVEPDENGNISIGGYSPTYATDTEAITGTATNRTMTPAATNAVIENIGYWKAGEAVSVNTIRFLRGAKYAGYFLICNTAGTTGNTNPQPTIGTTSLITDGSVKWYLRQNASKQDRDLTTKTYTASKQTARTISSVGSESVKLSGYNSTKDGGLSSRYDYTSTHDEYQITAGVSAGTYNLDTLLQKLIQLSHGHNVVRTNYHYNCECNCNCSDGDGGCIVSGNILTSMGYKSIETLEVGDFIASCDNVMHEVVGIKKSTIGKRKAISLECNKAVYTDDHLFLVDGEYKAYDVKGYLREASRDLTDGNVYGTYDREVKQEIGKLERVVVFDLPADTVTYTPIVKDCEWCVVNDKVVACARQV